MYVDDQRTFMSSKSCLGCFTSALTWILRYISFRLADDRSFEHVSVMRDTVIDFETPSRKLLETPSRKLLESIQSHRGQSLRYLGYGSPG